ncbi:hypothetical protein [Arthrobacter zhaoguopingii]|uniref:hypothetical protein n=1 Tax=Arthrobacter zhaoguopingii TaxID=2681491 RepID=UPI00135C02AE|nr:hypothetical protein [Arthrobacter zhaoguopingii]
MQRERVRYPLSYRRARTALFAVGLFWLWLGLSSADFIAGLSESPIHAFIAIYALAVAALVSLPAALLAGARMLLTRPRRAGEVLHLPVRGEAPETAPVHWWYGSKAS